MKNHTLTNKFTIKEMLESIKDIGQDAYAGKEWEPMLRKINEYLDMLE